jgi:hypothetical protein
LLFSVAYGQLDISRPISFQTDLLTPIPIYTTPEVDVRELLMEDSIQAVEGFKPNRVGQSFSTNITPNNTGRWETIENVKVWRVRLISNNAYSLKVTLSNFELPENASLFAYSEDGTFLMGPFTADYNVESRVLPIPLIPGEVLNRYHWEHDFTKSSANNDYFSMEETPLSPTLPKVERTSNILNVVVRPNPVETRFALDIYSETDNESSQIILYDLLGREVLREKTVLSKGGNTLKLNVGHLQSGMYYLKVMDSEGRFLSETIMKM